MSPFSIFFFFLFRAFSEYISLYDRKKLHHNLTPLTKAKYLFQLCHLPVSSYYYVIFVSLSILIRVSIRPESVQTVQYTDIVKSVLQVVFITWSLRDITRNENFSSQT